MSGWRGCGRVCQWLERMGRVCEWGVCVSGKGV